MVKKIGFVCSALLISFVLSSCAFDQTDLGMFDAEIAEEVSKVNSMVHLVCLGKYDDFTLFYDSVSGVMYSFHKSGYGGGLTVLYSADGLPLNYYSFFPVGDESCES